MNKEEWIYMKHFKRIMLLIIVTIVSINQCLALDSPKVQNMSTRWRTLGIGTGYNNSFYFEPDPDGNDKFYFSLNPPSDYKQGTELSINSWNNIVSGKVGMRLEGSPSSGQLGVNFGRWYNEGGLDGVVTGKVYLWHNDTELSEINYSYYYEPFAILSASTGTIDLGTCHKYQSSGISLNKSFDISLDVHGYTNNASYAIDRTIKSTNTPAGVLYKDSSDNLLNINESKNMTNFSTQPPMSLKDTIKVILNCDEAPVGNLHWSLSLTYTIS